MSCPELLIRPDSSVTSASASRPRNRLAFPVVDANYYLYWDALHRLTETNCVIAIHYHMTETSQARNIEPLIVGGFTVETEGLTETLRALTDQLRRGIVPTVDAATQELANLVAAQISERKDNVDEWARRLAQDVADADD